MGNYAKWAIAIIMPLSCLWATSLSNQALAQTEKEAQALDSYLESLGLADLRILNLEEMLNRDPDNGEAAKALADLYAGKLLVVSEAGERAALDQRIEELLSKHPEAGTPALQVMRLQGDFNRAETLASAWIGQPSDSKARESALDLLGKITPALDGLQTKLFSSLEAERKAVDDLPDGPGRSRREQGLDRLADVAGRALYFDAWANLYLGMMGDEDPTPRYERARTAFLKLLGVEADADVSAEMLASSGMARAALGLALSESLGGKDEEATALFQQVRSAPTSPDVRDMGGYWEAWTLFQRKQFGRLSDLVSRLGADLAEPPSDGRAALCALLVRAGYGSENPDVPLSVRSLADEGLNALVKMRLYERVKQLVGLYGINTRDRDGVVFRWAEGQALYGQARESKDAGQYQRAAEAFEAALKSSDASKYPSLEAGSRLLLAWCRYERGELGPASKAFGQAAAQLKALGDPEAADALWMQAVALEKLAEKEPARVDEAVSALQAFSALYPEHPNASLVDFEVRKLKGKPVTLSVLEAHQPGGPNFAKMVLAALQHHGQAWRDARSKGRNGAEEAENVRKVIDIFRSLPKPARSAEGELALVLAESALEAESDPALARAILDRARSQAKALSADDPRVLAYHRARLRLAQGLKDASSIQAEAVWMREHASGVEGTADKSMLISLAQLADSAVEKADAGERPGRLSEAVEAYSRLVSALGTSPETLRKDRNAFVALARLAGYESESGLAAQAADHYDAVLAAYPRDAKYLRLAGLAHYQAGQFKQALSCWDTLVAGLPDGSGPWFEAKYYQLSSLAKTDPSQARRALSQFQVLYPSLGTGRWPSLFRQLGQTLPGRGPKR